MRTAVFGDVHGNLPALEAFLDAVRGEVDAYLCLGDLVDYGPWSDECVDRVFALPHVTVLEGNHERLFLGTEPLDHEPPLVQAFVNHVRPAFTRTERIRGLPSSAPLGRFTATHTLEGRTVYADTAIDIDRHRIIGHSHHQYSVARGAFALLNPGSVGQNRKWIDRVEYMVHDAASDRWGFHALPYRLDLLVSELAARHYPQACLDYYAGKPRLGK